MVLWVVVEVSATGSKTASLTSPSPSWVLVAGHSEVMPAGSSPPLVSPSPSMMLIVEGSGVLEVFSSAFLTSPSLS